MNPTTWMNAPVWPLAGWTMLHYLWIGMAIGILSLIARRVFARFDAAVRYGVALGFLLALVAAPVGIAVWVAGHSQAINAPDQTESTAQTNAERASLDDKSGTPPADLPDEQHAKVTPALDTNQTSAHPVPTDEMFRTSTGTVVTLSPGATTAMPEPQQSWLPATMLRGAALLLPWLWIVGSPVTLFVLATGVAGAERLRRQSRILSDGNAVEQCRRLSATLKLSRRVIVGVCDRIASPILVGVVRPLILLPPAALLGWSPEQMEMVLLHELAHVRRWDNLVNLMQRIVEALLFFQPAVWLVSRWIRREREHCCDNCVLLHTGRPKAYARTLVELAGGRLIADGNSVTLSGRVSVAASSMAEHHIVARVRHILKREEDTMQVSRKTIGLLSMLLLVTLGVVLWYSPTPGRANGSEVSPNDAQREQEEQGDRKDDEKAEPAGVLGADEEAGKDEYKPAPKKGLIAGPNRPDAILTKGTIDWIDKVTLASNRAGIVEFVKARAGDSVKAGQEVAGLRKDDLQRAALELQLAVAKNEVAGAELVQLNKLVGKNVVARSRQIKAKSTARIAEIELKKAMLNHSILKRNITAPFDGIVTRVDKQPGEAVKQGEPILSIVGTSRVRITSSLPLQSLGQIKFGAPVRAELNVGDNILSKKQRTFRGKITFIDPTVEPVTRSVKIHAEIPNPDNILRAGLQVRMVIYRNEEVARTPRYSGADIRKVFGITLEPADMKSITIGPFQQRAKSKHFYMTIGAVDPGSPADKSGLKPGDILTQLNGWEIHTERDVFDVLSTNSQAYEYSFTRKNKRGESLGRTGHFEFYVGEKR